MPVNVGSLSYWF